MAVTYQEPSLFEQPARIIVSGFSNSGKSSLCERLIENNHSKFDTILYCGVESHPLQSNNLIKNKLIVTPTIMDPFEHYDPSAKEGILYVLDDCFLEAVQNKAVVDAFTKGRHKNISTIFITQNMFHAGKHSRNISLNCSHYILMRNRDLSQVETLGRQIFGRQKGGDFVTVYKRCMEINQYGYLLVDLAPSTPEALRLRTNILGETEHQIVFQC